MTEDEEKGAIATVMTNRTTSYDMCQCTHVKGMHWHRASGVEDCGIKECSCEHFVKASESLPPVELPAPIPTPASEDSEFPMMDYEEAGKEAYAEQSVIKFRADPTGERFEAHPDGRYVHLEWNPTPSTEESGEPTGVAAFFGTWPGEETDVDFLAALDEIRKPASETSDYLRGKLDEGGEPTITVRGKDKQLPHHLTVGKLKEMIAKLPDDAPVFIERIEDSYFKAGTGWSENSAFKPWDGDASHLCQYVQAYWPITFKDDDAVYLTPHY